MLNIDEPGSKDYIRKLKLSLWKSLTMRKNGFIITIFEVFLPVFFFLIILFFTMKIPAFETKYIKENRTYPPESLGMPLIYNLLYSPNSSDVIEFMNIVKKSMPPRADLRFINFVNEFEMRNYITGVQNNISIDAFNIICVVFDNYYKDSNELSYRILIEDTTNMETPFQDEAPYTTVRAKNYIDTGFVTLQKNIDFAFIDQKSSNKLSQENVNIRLERMPTPPHEIENEIMNNFVKPCVFSFSFICLFSKTLLPFMIKEKSIGLRQLMFSMGLDQWQYWLEWFLYAFFAYIFNTTILAVLFTINFTEKLPTFFDKSNGFIIWIFVFCFYICNIVVIFLLSAIFKSYRYAQIPVAIWIAIPFFMKPLSPEHFPFGVNILLMLIPNIGLIFGIHTLIGLERIGGVHFGNLFKGPSEYSNAPSIGIILTMFMVDSIIYFLLAWYIDNVFPGEFGVSKRWNFLFKKSFWAPTKEIDVKEIIVSDFEKKPEIEAVKGLDAGIQIRDLRKKYQRLYAVDGLNIDIYSKQITVLLGHNGAGKTTTISIITGMIPPTSGTVIIDGYNVATSRRTVQKFIGLCLQHNTEIPYLQVQEHLLYFAMLRGCSMADAKLDAVQFLELSNLKDKANTIPTKLSGGMRRKLSIGMAMIGKSKVVLLDEPTSGLDPQSRRELWDFLLGMRGERTILITTHYMEEADILGDRIAIMHNGQLICYGTPLFLKNFYGTGYTLSVLNQFADVSGISSLIKGYVSSAFIKSIKPGSITYTLPTNNSESLSKLVQALENNKSNLGIINFGICITSLEDVFIKSGEIADAAKGITKINQNWIQSDNELIEEFSSNILLSFKALAYKRLHYYRHNKLKTIFIIFLPIVFFICFYLFVIRLQKELNRNVNVDLKLDMYDEAESFYSHGAGTESVVKYYKNVVSAQGGKATYASDIHESIWDIAETDETQYLRTLITGAQFKSGTEIIAMYGHYALHGPPISLNLVTNSLLHSYTSDDRYLIKVAYGSYSQENKVNSMLMAYALPVIMIYSFIFFLPKCALILHNENATGFKHLQQMCGVPKFVYWISAFVFDFIIYLFIISIFLMLIFIVDHGGYIGNATTLAYVGHLLVIHGLSCIPFVYSFILSTLFSTNRSIENALTSYFVIFGLATPIVVFCFTVLYPTSNQAFKILFILFNYYPPHAFALALMKLLHKSCEIFTWSLSSYFLATLGHPCADMKSTKCKELLSFYKGEFSIAEHETALCWDILVHWVLLFLYDFGIVSCCLQFLFGAITCRICQVCRKPDAITDDDVLNERTRVIGQLKKKSKTKNNVERDQIRDLFLVRNLHKWYIRVFAVRGLYFGVKKGECFGLLGINGAGKTTTFRMLTGEIFPSAGNAYFNGINLNLNRCNFFKKMGYTPQFDGFIYDLTVHEMLYVLGSIRGIPSKKINVHIDKWLTIFDIHMYENVQCGKLSGGTKRKVSSALSLIGNPILILLDEPTSGIDPVARRNLWDVLAILQKSGRSIILTSQSMDECETLCDRLAIMVGGQFQCLGNIQHLKSKFGHGCTIKIKLRSDSTDVNLNSLKNLKQDISSRMECTLLDEHISMVVYKVTNKDIPLSFVFILMESLKNTYQIIEDYSISSANLEEIFLSFARNEY